MLFSNMQAPLAPLSAKQATFKAEHELISDLENSRSINLASIVLRCIDIAPEKSPALPKSYITTPLRLWNYLRVRQTRAFSKSLQAVKVL